MNDQQRIAALEQELVQLRAAFAEYARTHQELGGQGRAFEAAIFALVASHPRPDILGPSLQDHLAKLEAGVVAQAETDEHLQGVQDTQAVLLATLENAQVSASRTNLEIAGHLEAIRGWQDYTQGQVEALRVALFEIFQHAQANAELRSRAESHLENRLRLMEEGQEPQGKIAGYKSALKDLLAGFHSGNK
jgi:hypothetical protein